MTNKEYAAGLLIEAADLLNNESVGANGASKRYYEARSKRYDELANKAKSKYDQYAKAGYSDNDNAKEHKLSYELSSLLSKNDKESANYYDTRSKNKSLEERKYVAKESKEFMKELPKIHNKMSDKSAAIHDRINKRAGIHESVSFEMLEN